MREKELYDISSFLLSFAYCPLQAKWEGGILKLFVLESTKNFVKIGSMSGTLGGIKNCVKIGSMSAILGGPKKLIK